VKVVPDELNEQTASATSGSTNVALIQGSAKVSSTMTLYQAINYGSFFSIGALRSAVYFMYLFILSAAAWLLGSRVRIPLRAWMFVSCVSMLCCPV
jgi:hypothetical protein